MHAAFSQSQYVLKRKRLSFGGKYRLFGLQADQPVLYIEEKNKWFPPSKTIHVYADESKGREILTLKDSESEDIEMDVMDVESGQKIGGFGTSAENLGELVKDTWTITDASDRPIGQMFEQSVARSVLRDALDNQLPQKMDLTIGGTPVGELRQKVKAVGYQLAIDFTADATQLLDRRLGIAAALFAASHQDKTG